MIWLFLIFLQGIHSQELKRQMLASAGSSQLVSSQAGTYFIQQSVGQHSVIGSYRAANNELRQGFVQVLPAIVLGGDPNELEVVVYPNPFTNGVVVNFEQGLEDEISVAIFDMSGRLVQSNAYEATNQLTLPLLGLAQGAYFLKLGSGQQQTVKQLLKR